MKFKTALTVAALASLMALPPAASAQRGRGGFSGGHAGGHSFSGGHAGGFNREGGNHGFSFHQGNPGRPTPGPVYSHSAPARGSGGDHHGGWNRGGSGHQGGWNHGSWDRGGWDRGGWGDHHFYRSDHDDWRDILFLDGVLDFDILLNDSTVCFDGPYGGYYPVWQYQIDIVSSDPETRARAELFEHRFFYRDGIRFERRTVWHDGDRCYQFVRD
ncbi:MAG TPA: hypothetical protein VMI31_07840 [Fimbriimonadaceae bacterium]|nr:hypothetical protein [Fimbriimonadaceae bacterium]